MTVRIEPSTARYSLQDSYNGARASVPARRNWFVVLFLCAWLGGWTLGEISAISQIFHIKMGFFGDSVKSWHSGGELFIVFWLAGWTLGGIWAFGGLAWMLFGREIIGVEGGELIYRIEALGIGRTRVFAGNQLARLRAIDMDASLRSGRSVAMRAPALFGQGTGSIAFDYGARAYRIGVSLDETEARLLIQQLKRWLPEGAIAN